MIETWRMSGFDAGTHSAEPLRLGKQTLCQLSYSRSGGRHPHKARLCRQSWRASRVGVAIAVFSRTLPLRFEGSPYFPPPSRPVRLE
jgi:hypothetical protein